MAEVGRVTPGKPIWPEHHGEIPERAPRREQEEKEGSRKPPPQPAEGGDAEPTRDEQEPGSHLDEYA